MGVPNSDKLPCHDNVLLVSTSPHPSSRIGAYAISYPEPSNFLRHMLNENEGSGKDQFLGDPDCLSEIQYNTISPLFADY